MSNMYPYANGDLLHDRNSYAYSAYHGEAFFDSWYEERTHVLDSIPAAPVGETEKLDPEVTPITGFPVRTGELIAWLKARLRAGRLDEKDNRFIDWLIQRFEVTKRVHEAYGANGLAQDKSKFHDRELYVAYAELMAQLYSSTHRLDVLNVLLKIMDTLCAFVSTLTVPQQSRLRSLIIEERRFFENLQRKVQGK